MSTSYACGTQATVTDGNRNSKTFYHDAFGHVTSITEGTYTTAFDQDANGLVTKVTYPEGNSIEYNYDTANTGNRARANLLSITENPGPRGASDPDEPSRTSTFSYENFYNQVSSMAMPDKLQVNNSNPDDHGSGL